MLFPTFEFFTFFTVVLVLNWFLKRWPLAWRLFLLLASYYFYSIWDIKFLLILILVSFFNFFTGIAIYRNFWGTRKITFLLAIIFNLLVLGFFKYYDFFRVSAEELLGKIGLPVTFSFLEIVLPVGLSFYIFRTISYNADIYLEKLVPTFSLLDFSIYVAFFPQLLSGPIARAGDFLPQLQDGGAKEIGNLYENLNLILFGLFKKLVISSYLVLNITDDVFAVPENHSSLIILLAILAYSLVIYCDFSGYSDMAIGFAGLMGFRSPINFNTPYLATNFRDFWRRWHITLSNWARDYIYIPLGGNRKGLFRECFNIMAVMILIGLWHGAASHFIIWGALHGGGLIISHINQKRKKFNLRPQLETTQIEKCKEVIKKIFGWFITFGLVSFFWIFFRANNIERALTLIKNLFAFENIVEPFKIYILFLIGIGFLFVLLEKRIMQGLLVIQMKLPTMFWFIFIIVCIILILKFSPDILPPFIYFGF